MNAENFSGSEADARNVETVPARLTADLLGAGSCLRLATVNCIVILRRWPLHPLTVGGVAASVIQRTRFPDGRSRRYAILPLRHQGFNQRL